MQAFVSMQRFWYSSWSGKSKPLLRPREKTPDGKFQLAVLPFQASKQDIFEFKLETRKDTVEVRGIILDGSPYLPLGQPRRISIFGDKQTQRALSRFPGSDKGMQHSDNVVWFTTHTATKKKVIMHLSEWMEILSALRVHFQLQARLKRVLQFKQDSSFLFYYCVSIRYILL